LKVASGSKKPKFIKFIKKSYDDEKHPEVFYFYSSIGGAILVHSIEYCDLIENPD